MSIFICTECDNLRDANDGCDALPGTNDLICADCMVELGCAWCSSLEVVTTLDGEKLCGPCATKWCQAEGQAQQDAEAEAQEHASTAHS